MMVGEISDGKLTLKTWEEVQRELDEERAFQATLKPSDPRHARMFAFDLDLGYLDIYWGGYEYSYELKRLDNPLKLLAFLDHVLAKGWEHASSTRINKLIRAVSRHFGWNLYRDEYGKVVEPNVRTTSAAQERAKLTPKLRYDVLLRDDYRCRACGFSVESGAHLHIDHIVPVARGGCTVFENLQALCSVCNQGKGARK